MSSTRATLSALRTNLDDVMARVTAEAERYAGTDQDDVAIDLYEVERSLRAANRRLERLLDRL